MRKKFELIYQCDQDWDSMTVTDKGKFCSLCNKHVVDFTTLTSAEIDLYKNDKKLCARFYDYQMNTDIIRPIETTKYLRLMMFFSAISVAVSGKNSFIPIADRPKTEQSQIKDTFINGSYPLGLKESKNDTCPPVTKKPFLKTKKRKFFWTKRFPFINVVRTDRIFQGNLRYFEK